ncbi:MAG TPA: M23 family metallopeptidase [Actinomycetota bacterium]|nr:M23 family metallopeptidase [Actinomycetota bacterium]
MEVRHVLERGPGQRAHGTGQRRQPSRKALSLVALSLAALLALIAAAPAGRAEADALSRAHRLRRQAARRVEALERKVERLAQVRKRLFRQVRRAEPLVAVVETPWFIELALRRGVVEYRLEDARRLLRRLEQRKRRLARRIRELELRRLDQLALVYDLVLCPVDEPRSFVDDFGVVSPRDEDGDGTVEEGELHVHQGIDIFAPEGTPVRAPFSGVAVDATNPIGGLAVKVYGPRGYVYNAHLSSIARLGPVRVGEVIGYVGTTGNALGTSPHDHFEWHPWNGEAANPYWDLARVC